jgi:hypothetical protein
VQTLLRRARTAHPAPGYALIVASRPVETQSELSPDRAWWLRVPAVFLSPKSVFFALRDEDPEDVAARSEPILLLVWLAGAAAVLSTPKAGVLLDKAEWDGALLAIWAFVMGGIYGAAGYLVAGFALFFGARLLGTMGGFRRERQIVGFALAPLALSLLVLLPLRLALFGDDVFHEGGSDEGAGENAMLALQLAFAGWSVALLVVGVRVVHGWSWLRATGVVAAAAALLGSVLWLVAS